MVDLLLEMHAPDIELRMITRTKKREQPNIVVHELEEGQALETANGLTATAFKVDHYPLEMPFGFRFDTKDKSVAFSGDTCPSENLIKHTRGVDIWCTNAPSTPSGPTRRSTRATRSRHTPIPTCWAWWPGTSSRGSWSPPI